MIDPQNGGIWYLGECCVRQLRRVITNPDNPIMELSYISHEDYFDYIRTIMWPSIDRFYVKVSHQKYNV